MDANEAAAFSRPVAAAAALGEAAEDRHRFINKRVLLTGENAVLVTPNGHRIAHDALMLLIRVCANVTVGLPASCVSLRDNLQRLARDVHPGMVVEFVDEPFTFEGFDAILSIGIHARSDLPWTVINSHGWLARVSSGASHLSQEYHQANPIGALAAASLGVCETFKRLIALRAERGALIDGLSFSLWTYSRSDDPGPTLPAQIRLRFFLVGAGAIGNGISHLISNLPITGEVVIVDPQCYGAENWGTSLRLRLADVGRPKAAVLSEILKPNMSATALAMNIGDLENQSALPYPKIVLGGLDNVDARHSVQSLWPDIAIDGAIGSDFSCQVSCHPWGRDIGCMLCVFQLDSVYQRAEVVASKATGLSEALCAQPDAVLTEYDVFAAPEGKRAWLAERVGKTICSVIAEADLQKLSTESQRVGFAPSVPFVACYSACMVVTELTRYLETGQTVPTPRWQMNMLWGPDKGIDFPEPRGTHCFCVARSRNIERIRASRACG